MHNVNPVGNDPSLLNELCRKLAVGQNPVGSLQAQPQLWPIALHRAQYFVPMGIGNKRELEPSLQPKPQVAFIYRRELNYLGPLPEHDLADSRPPTRRLPIT
jgi:hypothetical protein